MVKGGPGTHSGECSANGHSTWKRPLFLPGPTRLYPMRLELEESLEREARKLIRRHSTVLRQAAEYRKRFAKRTGKIPGQPTSKQPLHWSIESHFDPFHVRGRKSAISHSISAKIRKNTYLPRPALHKSIPKPNGGLRTLSIFTVPDSAVSYWLYRKLLDRNAQLFSSFSYAYRADRNAHHAIDHISRFVKGRQRIFILEYDFSRYFDSIEHDYLLDVIKRNLRVSPWEKTLIEAFLKSQYADGIEAYRNRTFVSTEKGIPQGTSLSLFLANVACLELDRELENTGVVFARYADDTIILCEDYSAACRAASLMLAHGDRSGARVNFEKSGGISLISPSNETEIRNKLSFVFLGHEISSHGVTIADRTLNRMRQTMARIMHRHLLLHPKKGEFNINRIRPLGVDWDLVTCLNELRNYLYGRISEGYLSNALARHEPLKNTRCALSYFPLVDLPDKIRTLDGWLVRALMSAYKERTKVLASMGHTCPPISKQNLISGSWYQEKQIKNETKLPSAFKAWLYIRKCYNTFGLRHFPSPPYPASS